MDSLCCIAPFFHTMKKPIAWQAFSGGGRYPPRPVPGVWSDRRLEQSAQRQHLVPQPGQGLRGGFRVALDPQFDVGMTA